MYTHTKTFDQQRFKNPTFSLLFLVCLLQVIPKNEKLLALQIAISVIVFNFTCKHAFQFHCPFIHPSTLPSLPHYPIIVLSLV